MREKKTYRRDLEEAQSDLLELLMEREDLEQRIAKAKRRAALLAQLAEDNEAAEGVVDLDLRGLRDVCMTALRASRKEWMTIAEIQSAINELGFPLQEYKAPTASITTTVNRLESDDGLVESARISGGTKVYKWVGPQFGAAGLKHALKQVKK
jgi:hypothetical protein